MANVSAVSANIVFQYVALVYSKRVSDAKAAAKKLGVKKALSIANGDYVHLVNIGIIPARERKWSVYRIKAALSAYQQEPLTHSYNGRTAKGVILCPAEQERFLRQSIDDKIFPKDTKIGYIEGTKIRYIKKP